jgi:hypothetical protein
VRGEGIRVILRKINMFALIYPEEIYFRVPAEFHLTQKASPDRGDGEIAVR